MTTTRRSCIHRLGAVGLGLALVACGGGADDTTAGTTSGNTTSGNTTGGPGSTSTPMTAGTTGDTGNPTTGGTTDLTTGGPTDPTGSTGAPSTTTTTDTTAGGSSSSASSGGPEVTMGFFVSSTGSPTGDLGGLAGADQRCQDLADAVGAGDRTWHAYLSVEHGPDDGPIDARDRIGAGPWYNADLVLLATDVDDLHTKAGDYTLFLDEHGEPVPGQWDGSPDPNEHDILTGTAKDGTLLVGKTCQDWTSADPALFAQVGHSDGLGPMGNDDPMYRPWNSVHESGGCHDTAPKGGAGRVYCFAVD